MKLIKYLGIVVLFLISLLSVNAVLDDAEAYYSFDEDDVSVTTLIDLSDNSNNGTCTTMGGDCNTVAGLLNNASDFDGVDDEIIIPDDNTLDVGTGDFAVSGWINIDGAVHDGIISKRGTGGADVGWFIRLHPTDTRDIRVYMRDASAGEALLNFDTNLNTGTWYHMVMNFDRSGNAQLYIDGNSISNQSISTASGNLDNTFDLKLGWAQTHYWDGKLDEFALYKRLLTASEISELYNGGAGYNPYTAPPAPPAIVYNVTDNDYLNYQPTIGLTTTSNVNMSYILNAGSEISICTNCNSSSITPTLVYGQNNFTFISTDENGQTNSTLTLYYDNINPSLTVTSPSEVNTYEVNFSSLVSCSDDYIDYCNVTTDEGLTFSYTNNSYYFSTNGNHTFNVTAVDLAGNSNTSTNNIVLVNPYQYFYFNSTSTGTLLENYTVETTNGTYSVTGSLFQIPLYDLGLGNHSMTFKLSGYENTTFYENFTTTSDINRTVQVNPVTLTIKIYDASSPSTQLYFNVTIINSTNSSTFLNQFDFSQEYSNFPTEDIEIIIESIGYSQAKFYQTINPYTSITINGYLFSDNVSDIVQFTVQDKATSSPLEDVLIELQALINGSYVTLSQKKTGAAGDAFFYTDITESYKIIFSKSGYVTATSFTIPTVTSYTVQLESTTTTFEYIDDVSFAITPTETILFDNRTYSFSGFISGTSLTSTTYTVAWGNGTVIYTDTSTNPTGTTYNTNVNIPLGINQTEITVTMNYYKDGTSNEILKTYQIISFTNNTFLQTMENYGESTDENDVIMRWITMMIVTVGIIIMGATLGHQGVNFLLIPAFAFFSLVGWIDWVSAAIIGFVIMITFMGVRR